MMNDVPSHEAGPAGEGPADAAHGDAVDCGMHAAPWESLRPTEVGAADVQALIQRADAHELGRDFLLEGAQDAVAATFGVHAFVVDAARAHLGDSGT